MTGARGLRKSEFLIAKKEFLLWLDSLSNDFSLIGPVQEGPQTVFRKVRASGELNLAYESTMLPPGKTFLFPPREDLFTFNWKTADLRGEITIDEVFPQTDKSVLIGIHPCDFNAVLYLDRTFLGDYKDPFYEMRRKNTILISLNCEQVGPNCFCSSMGTGPFLKAAADYDMLITDLDQDYLVEIKSMRAAELFSASARNASVDDFAHKNNREKTALGKFRKSIRTEGLDTLLAKNAEHPVWSATADEKCLSCANCVMVCPTCFCYNMVDEMSMDLASAKRFRHWDACQGKKFAEVFGGNFRLRRLARLRQFVTHKLDQTFQYGVFGTVGCGRCITWCPTHIDLTDIIKEIAHESS